VRVVETLGPAPIQPVVVRADLEPATRRSLQAGLLGLGAAELAPFLVSGFALPPDYSGIFEVLSSRTDDRGDRHLPQPAGSPAPGTDPVGPAR
jgi:hypothetical protein